MSFQNRNLNRYWVTDLEHVEEPGEEEHDGEVDDVHVVDSGKILTLRSDQ